MFNFWPLKVPGRVLGRVPGKGALLEGLPGAVPFGCFSKENGLPALLPAVPPAVPLFPSTLPVPGSFGDSGFLSPVAGGQDSNPRRLSGPLNRDGRYYLSDTPSSAIPSRGQLELQHPPPPLGRDRVHLFCGGGGAIKRDTLRYLKKNMCDSCSHSLTHWALS